MNEVEYTDTTSITDRFSREVDLETSLSMFIHMRYTSA